MLTHVVTTIEAKSGYGLDLETEIRLVEVAYRLGLEGPIEFVPTYLGAHAVAPEFRSRPTGPRRTSGRSSRTSCPGIAAHGRAKVL
jgi:imidazolonepropionase